MVGGGGREKRWVSDFKGERKSQCRIVDREGKVGGENGNGINLRRGVFKKII